MEKDKFADILTWIGIIAIAIAAVLIGSMNHYKAHYQNAKPLSYQEACDFAKTAAGYPPGEDIPVAKSIEIFLLLQEREVFVRNGMSKRVMD